MAEIMDMFRRPSTSYRMINQRQLEQGLQQMHQAHQEVKASWDLDEPELDAANESLSAAERSLGETYHPAYEAERQHRIASRNPYGIDARQQLPGSAHRRVGEYEFQLTPSRVGTKWSHMVHATHIPSGERAGMLTWDHHTGEIGGAFVEEDHQRKGLASKMIGMARDYAASVPRMTSPLPSPLISADGTALTQGLMKKNT